jgi:hypothetical protein
MSVPRTRQSVPEFNVRPGAALMAIGRPAGQLICVAPAVDCGSAQGMGAQMGCTGDVLRNGDHTALSAHVWDDDGPTLGRPPFVWETPTQP